MRIESHTVVSLRNPVFPRTYDLTHFTVRVMGQTHVLKRELFSANNSASTIRVLELFKALEDVASMDDVPRLMELRDRLRARDYTMLASKLEESIERVEAVNAVCTIN